MAVISPYKPRLFVVGSSKSLQEAKSLSRNWAIAIVLVLVVGLAVSTPEKRVILSSEVENKIKAGELAEFDNCIIAGDLNLREIKIKDEVHFNDTLFRNSVDFQSAIFNDDSYFGGSVFNSHANFGYSVFNETAYFLGSTFNAPAYFSGVSFNSPSVFSGSIFNGPASFSNTKFNFINSEFSIDFDAEFSDSIFNGNADFREARFNGTSGFGHSKFNSLANFGSAFFNGTTIFEYSRFNDSAFFTAYQPAETIGSATLLIGLVSGIQTGFNDTVDFEGCSFNGPVDFSDNVFNSTAIFYDSEFKKKAVFDDVTFGGSTSFNSCRFLGDALFEGATFYGKLDLKRTKYDKLYIKWSNIKNGLEYDESSYQQLIENFKNLGYFNDADNSYYSFRNGNREQMSLPFKQVDWTLMALYGYGTRPERPIYWAIIVIFFCSLVFYLTNGIQKSNGQKISVHEALLFSATILISGARAIGVFVSDPSDLKIIGNSRYLVTIERFLGLVLFALFLTALARTVIR